MNDYQLDRKAKADIFIGEVRAIASALPGTWSLNFHPDDDGNYPGERLQSVTDTTGRSLWFHEDWRNGKRIEISGCGFPTYTNENGQETKLSPRDCWNPKAVNPETTAARGRPAAAIAKQIVSKIFPGYDEIMVRLNDLKKDRENYARKTENGLRKLATACGNVYKPGSRYFYVEDMPGETLRIEARSGSSCQIDLTIDETIAVIKLIRKRRAKND